MDRTAPAGLRFVENSEMSADIPITLHWHCSCFVGPCKWHGTEDYEPDECNTDFTAEDTLENWDAGYCNAICPSCGAELTQKFDSPEMTKEFTV